MISQVRNLEEYMKIEKQKCAALSKEQRSKGKIPVPEKFKGCRSQELNGKMMKLTSIDIVKRYVKEMEAYMSFIIVWSRSMNKKYVNQWY